jgi:hypothetical protein
VFSKKANGTQLPSEVNIHKDIIRIETRIYVGAHNQWRGKLVQSLYDSSLRGHYGILGTYKRVKKLFTWSKLKEGVIHHVQNYDIYQMNKGELISVLGLLEPIAIPEGDWEVICMDFIGGLSKSEGKDIILVILDKLTKYYHLIALSLIHILHPQ